MAAAPDPEAPDWLGVCRRASAEIRDMLADRPTIAERVKETGTRGEGGDQTLLIDEAAEDVVFAELDKLHAAGARFTALSEERGVVDFGSDDLWVVIDPIDGSNNAKRGLPHFALSIAVAEGETMADVVFGYVHDLGTGEEWTARRGGGAFLNGVALEERPKDELELLSFEATTTDAVAAQAASMVGVAKRLRIMGSLAIALCNLSAGRLD